MMVGQMQDSHARAIHNLTREIDKWEVERDGAKGKHRVWLEFTEEWEEAQNWQVKVMVQELKQMSNE